MNFKSGWLPEAEAKAKAAWHGSPPIFSSELLAGIDISMPNFTLADQIKFWLNQGPVGSCFANAVVNSCQIGQSFAVSQGADYSEIQLSRRAVWYYGRYLDGVIGNPSDGGSITNAIRAVHDYGIPHESEWPYKPDHNWLETPPPQSVLTDSKEFTIKGMIALNFNDTDGIKRSIAAGLPPVMGIWWRYSWDTTFDENAIVGNSGSGTYGHALAIIGWTIWNGVLGWHILNSHGPIYPAKALGILGFAPCPTPGKTYAFWVSHADLITVVNMGNSELVAPIGVVAPKGAAAILSWLDAAQQTKIATAERPKPIEPDAPNGDFR